MLKKIGSRSDTMLLGNPCNLHTISKNKLATLNTVKPVGKAPRCTPLEYRSTTANITVKPLERGRCVMKSIDRSSHTPAGIGNGYRRLAGRLVEFLFCWNMEHSLMKRRTSCFRFIQKKLDSIRWVVLAKPRWPPSGVAWYSVNRMGMHELSLFNHILPLNRIKSLQSV